METIRRCDSYGRPGDDEEDFLLSGKALGKKYPEWNEFSDPTLTSFTRNSITGQVIEKHF